MQNLLNTLRQKSESGDRRAVSPVIGVILMVAITVVLAATIGIFVLGFTDDVSQSPTAGISIDGDRVTLTSLASADSVEFRNGSDTDINLTEVGDSTTLSNSNYSAVAISGDDEAVFRTFEINTTST